MLWAIYRVSKPNVAEIRAAKMPAHREYLSSQKNILLFSGPLLSDDGTEHIGTWFILNVNSRAEAQAFLDGEPFWQAGLFASATISRMRKGRWNPELWESIPTPSEWSTSNR